MVLAFRDHLEASYSDATAHRTFGTVRTFYEWQDGVNPFSRVKAPRRKKNVMPKVPQDSVVDAVIAVCSDPRDRAVLALLLNGLRAQEVCDLRKDDLFEDRGDLWLRVTGKGMKERLVPLGVDAATALSNYHNDTIWLVARESGQLSRHVVRWVVETWSKLAGVRLHPHALRHHYATRLIRAGANVFSVSKLLGHESIRTTQIYVDMDTRDLQHAAKLDPRNNTGPKLVSIPA